LARGDGAAARFGSQDLRFGKKTTLFASVTACFEIANGDDCKLEPKPG